jgi:hypothetical protein
MYGKHVKFLTVRVSNVKQGNDRHYTESPNKVQKF